MIITTDRAEYSSYPSTEWIVDFDSGDDSAPESNLASVAQDVRFCMETERYKYPIMGPNFGVSFDDLVGTDYAYIRSEVARRIQDALSIDDRIISVGNFTFTNLDNSGMLIKCTVSTIFGDVNISTTISG